MESLAGVLLSLIHWLEGSRSLEQVEEVTSQRSCRRVLGDPSLGAKRATGGLELSRFSETRMCYAGMPGTHPVLI